MLTMRGHLAKRSSPPISRRTLVSGVARSHWAPHRILHGGVVKYGPRSGIIGYSSREQRLNDHVVFSPPAGPGGCNVAFGVRTPVDGHVLVVKPPLLSLARVGEDI